MNTTTLIVEGMNCDACVRAVTNALQDLSGVQTAHVSLAEGQATVTYAPETVTVAQMVDAITEEGYKARPRA